MGISAICKAKAREALKGHWLTALLIALVVNLPSLLVQGIASLTGNDLILKLQELALYSASAGTEADQARIIAGLEEIMHSSAVWSMPLMSLAAGLVTPCLSLGMMAWFLGRLRGGEDPGVGAVFSRIRLFFCAIGMQLYIIWRVFLWTLPGIGLSLLATVPVLVNPPRTQIDAANAVNSMMAWMSVGMIVAGVLAVMAALKYAMSELILADHPEMGPVQAAKESKKRMQKRRSLLFSVYLGFILWNLAVMMGAILIESITGRVIGLVLQMLGSLFVSVYMNGALTAFYLGMRPEETHAEEGAEKEPLTGDERDGNP